MLRAYKYRLYPSQTQKELLAQYFGVVRLVYNIALDAKTSAYASTRTSISRFDLQSQLLGLKEDYDYVKNTPSQSLQVALLNLDTAYGKFFKGQGGFPKFKNRYKKQSISFPQGVKIDFTNNKISFPKLKWMDIDYSREFNGKVKTVTISKTPTNKYFVSILVENSKPLPDKVVIKEETAVGIDFGLKTLAVTSNGEHFENKRFYQESQKKLRIAQRSLSRKKKGSNRRENQRLVVALLHEKVRNQRNDYLHKMTTSIINKYNTIAIEDLAVNNMQKNKKLAKSISDAGWGTFRSMLEYKAEWYGKNIKVIGRFEPSSKICNICGDRNNDLKLHHREWTCSSGHKLDRDINAAKNIMNFGLRTRPVGRQREALACA